MFCKNCGKEIDAVADFCTACGVAKGKGENFCENCGTSIAPGAAVCLNCGCAASKPTSEKSKILAGVLAILVGYLGIHNFYLGYTKKGIIQLVVYLGLAWTVVAPIAVGIWAIVEAVQIFMGKIPDAEGRPLKD